MCKVKHLSIYRCYLFTIYIWIFVYNLYLYQGNTLYHCPMEYVWLCDKGTLYIMIYWILKNHRNIESNFRKTDNRRMYLLNNVNLSFVKNNIMVNKYFVQYPFFLSEVFFSNFEKQTGGKNTFQNVSCFHYFSRKELNIKQNKSVSII